ncbi:MAG: hypothetical protein PUP92_13725 [Rhizonema sp. PD38]|nr:hypothetical protein [Rhizonema sp. PD38]
MALKKQKGFRIETKTLKSKLNRDGINLSETVNAFNEYVIFYLQIINDSPDGVDLPSGDDWRFYELATTSGRDNRIPLFSLPFDAPSDFRRSSIRKALGHYRSWRSNYERWQRREQKRKTKTKGKPIKAHKPPVLPTLTKDHPCFTSEMYKGDNGNEIMLKIRKNGTWAWVKFTYQSYRLDDWGKASPTLVVKQDEAWLNWCVERYQPATGGLKAQTGKRVCSVDLDLDGKTIATCSVLEPNVNGEVNEVARQFVKGHSEHVRRRKRDLGQIAKKMNQTGIINSCFAKNRFVKISNRERSEGFRIANEIIAFAVKHNCTVIVFEYLKNLRPQRGRYSRRSNQKRAYWLKSKVQDFTTRIARQNHNILTAFVNPKGTSKFSAIDGAELLRTSDYDLAELIAKNPKIWDDFNNKEGYHPGIWAVSRCGYMINSGLNAARNIGMRFLLRSNEKLLFVRMEVKRLTISK